MAPGTPTGSRVNQSKYQGRGIELGALKGLFGAPVAKTERMPQARQIPRVQLRDLIVGRANAGKTSILQQVCNTTYNLIIHRGNSYIEGGPPSPSPTSPSPNIHPPSLAPSRLRRRANIISELDMACTDVCVSLFFPHMSKMFPGVPNTHHPSQRVHPTNIRATQSTALPTVGTLESSDPAPVSKRFSAAALLALYYALAPQQPRTARPSAPFYARAVIADAAGLRCGPARRGAEHSHAPRAGPFRRRAALIPGRPPPRVTPRIASTLYDGLRPATLFGALGSALKELGLVLARAAVERAGLAASAAQVGRLAVAERARASHALPADHAGD
ncbi:hypothetical protein EDB92DRAFT_2103691 [Lactarius akahatsu]|uniref:G domain-containing protein n=1 Tax=Lactarius akahatsu TaxID=416441 RepID=A0AAD4LL49_9AGAM|nr:hypothetical protein EDB92DRAFT_2103691 [Lactarius akahatsu]